MMTKYAILLALLLAALVPNTSLGGFIGEPASPLVVKEWIKGGPLDVKAGTNIYVLEVFQTKGVASRAAVANLNRLQNRYQTNGLVVVGISDEPVDTLKDFIQHDGTNIEYAIAADEHRQTSMAYMEPAGQIGVPYSFIVGTNGTLLWHGHVLRGLDQAVAQIIAGTFDLERARKMDVASHQMQQYLMLAHRGDTRTRAAGRVLLAARTNDVELLCDMAFEIATSPQLHQRDFALAGRALDQAQKLAPTNSARVMIYRAIWLFQGGRMDAGLLLATQALASASSPEEKSNVQSLLGTMAARAEVIKEEQIKKAQQSKTNEVNAARAPAPVDATTNKTDPTAPPSAAK
jgi:hypothetical protein